MTPLILILFLSETVALIGFDCGGQHLNVTAVSLLDVGECDLNIKKPNTTEIHIQLLQLSDYSYTEVIQCKVEISRNIYHCGMHSHVSAVHNGRADYVQETGYSQCLRMFQDGILSFGDNNLVTGIKVNQTTYRSITIAGRVQVDGYCKGTQYNDPYGTWDDVVVQAAVKISLKSSYVPIQLNTGKIKLKSGTICDLVDGFCLDADDGHTYWKSIPTTTCNFHQYDVLYEGPANKITEDTSEADSPVIYSLVTQDITFALMKTTELPLCGYTLLRTEHPKLFILEAKPGNTFATRGIIPVNNLDIFTYMNSKFVYIEKHVKQQMTSLYNNVISQKCELERQVIMNALSFATLQPDEFAYRLMKGPGYMAVTTGEAVQIIKCIPVEVKVRRAKKCYIELPITVRNASFFLTPKSRIITKIGNERECSIELPTLYRIEDTWVQITPEIQIRQLAPDQLKPMAALSWRYLTPGPLAVSGIYSDTDLEKLRNHIMFPAEKPALLNAVARGLTGHSMNTEGISVYNLLDENSLNKIVESTVSKIWKGFINFGSATAGIVGIFMIIRLIKLAIDTIIHGYALHTVYGCSFHLLGALWSSLANLLLHLAREPERQRGSNSERPSSDRETACRTTTIESTAPPEIIVQQPAPVKPPRMTKPCSERNNGNTENVNMPITYSHLREHITTLEQNVQTP